MPEGAGGQELPYAGTPEMDALLQQVNQNPAIMQQIAQEPALLAELLKHIGVDKSDIMEVSQWMDDSADKASGSAASEPQPTAAGDDVESDVASPPADTSASPAPMTEGGEDETIADDEAAEGDTAGVPSADDVAMGSDPAMARMNPGAPSPMDELISAQMMQRAAGDPNASVPRVGGKGKNPRMPMRGAPQGGGNQQQMIAELYRQMAARQQQPRR